MWLNLKIKPKKKRDGEISIKDQIVKVRKSLQIQYKQLFLKVISKKTNW